MNILFFITPKRDVAYLFSDDTIRQAMEKMEHHRYSCVPIIDKEGTYRGTITEGDVLWGLKNLKLENLKETEKGQYPKSETPQRLQASLCRDEYGRAD